MIAHRPLIWLVEDSAADARLFTEAAAEHGLAADIAVLGDGAACRAAIAAVGTGRAPDLVLLDLVLPDCTGRELLTALKEAPATARVPVVLLTTSDRFATDPDNGHPHVPDDYLIKPGNWDQYWGVMQTVRELLDLRPDASLSSLPAAGSRAPGRSSG